MDEKTMKDLKRGDFVKHTLGHKIYVVTGNYGGRVTAVLSADITNPSEWEQVIPSPPTRGDEG